MHLMSKQSFRSWKVTSPKHHLLEILTVRTCWLVKKHCANDLKNGFSLTKILSNCKNKLVILNHSLEEGNCCTYSTVNSKDSDKFHTKPLKKINWAFDKQKLQTFLHTVCTLVIPSSHKCISDHQTCFSWTVKSFQDEDDVSDFFIT